MLIKIISQSNPDNPPTGYADEMILETDSGKNITSFPCSTCPNPYNPKTKKRWYDYYGWIALGEYTWDFYKSDKYGDSLVINQGREVASRIPNWRHNDRKILTEVLIHVGGFNCKNPLWRGSAGCITLHRTAWRKFIKLFGPGASGKLIIINKEDIMSKFSIAKGVKKATLTAIPAGVLAALGTAGVALMDKAPEVVSVALDTLGVAAGAATAVSTAVNVNVDVPTTALVTVGTWLLKLVMDWIKHRK